MAALIIWMTSDEARLFHVDANSIQVEKLHYHGVRHPDETLGKNHPRTQTDEEKFFSQLTEKMKESPFETMLLMGPSYGPVNFVSYLERHASQFLRKMIGVERVDKMLDSEILTIGRKYLHRHYLYNPS